MRSLQLFIQDSEGNNVQMKYLHGDYGGIPLIGKINLKALAQESKKLISY